MQLTAEKVIIWNDENAPVGVLPDKVYIGPATPPLGGFQVAVATSSASASPSRKQLRDLFTARKGKTQIQLVVAIEHLPTKTVQIFGPSLDGQPLTLPAESAERQLQSVLDEPTLVSASARFTAMRKAADTSGGHGFVNSGLFASHHLAVNVPKRSDWRARAEAAKPLLRERGPRLLKALGFESRPGPNGTQLLVQQRSTSAQQQLSETPPRVVAVLLDESENFDAKSQRFQLSPVAFGLGVAAHQNVPWLVVMRKDQIRLYPGRDGIGVGSKGQAETYFEIDLATIDAEYAALLPLIFSADSLALDGTTDELLADSSRYATALGNRLRERIYDNVVESLSVEVAKRLAARGVALDSDGLSLAYRVTLRILFRLLFQAYAEDRGLLPAGRNEGFDANSLKTNAQRLKDADIDSLGDSATVWLDLVQVWNAIDKGNPSWQVPAYNGGLFSADPSRSPEGALIHEIELPDSVLGPALRGLLVDETEDGVEGLVDFRSLSVREFGTIYEGLLESSLSVAEEDLTVDQKGAWVPAKDCDEVRARAGSVYFHSASGERKATGSYFTPKVVVDHLIERSIVPALNVHLEKIAGYLRDGDAALAAREFFDFRVADIAMGSGHFLVAAVDKIESLMRTFLTEHSVPGVTDELLRLARVARDALGSDDIAKSEVDEIGLLRRQIARRCIYGIDVNPMAVELGRLALWIHTFVPGLPMSNLDHGLVAANSLTGIGTIEEAVDALAGTDGSAEAAWTSSPLGSAEDGLFAAAEFDAKAASGYEQWLRNAITSHLAGAVPLLMDLGSASEATKAEVDEAAVLLEQARVAAEPARRMLDAAVAARLGLWHTSITVPGHLSRLTDTDVPTRLVEDLTPAHMPYLFPEVFLRERPGFDVIIGNPPWEELMVEEPKFWLRVRPGLLGLKPAAMKAEIARLRAERPDMVAELDELADVVGRTRQVILKGPYPGLGTGDIDLYQAFSWRFLHLLRDQGHLAIVVPRSLLNAAGPKLWREAVFSAGDLQAVTLVNNRRWVFPIDPRYSFALVAFHKTGQPSGRVQLCGPFFDEKSFLAGRSQLGAVEVSALRVTTASTVPQISSPLSAEVLNVIRRAPRLDERRPGWDFRPVREFDATNDRPTFDGVGGGAVPVLGGAGFDLWNPDTGEVYAYGSKGKIEAALQAKRQRQVRLKSSAFHGLPQAWAEDIETLPMRHPRIAFRDIARSTDTRTAIAALLPPGVALTNKAPYLFRREGSASAEAYLVGVLSSLPLDWYARKYVEMGMNFHILNGLPVPVYDSESILANRVVEVAGRLAAVDARYADWASDVGVPVGSVESREAKDDLIAELDALVSLRYGLSEDQVNHVFATFHRGWDYETRLTAVLDHYRNWKGHL